MIGMLPTTLNIDGKDYEIRSDFRNILSIFEAYADDELSDNEKLYICLKRMFTHFEEIPHEKYEEAFRAVSSFMACNMDSGDKHSPTIVDWQKDESLIFPAVNKAAGCEVRALPYLHWWTFMGYYQSVDNESLLGFVLTIRQKKAKGKKLEKYEKEFLNNNRELCAINAKKIKPKKVEDDLMAMFEQLAEEGEE